VAIAGNDVHGGLFALEPDAVRCPHAVFERLRQESPVAWVEEIEAFAVTRYADIVEVNRQPLVFSNRMPTGPVIARQFEETAAVLAQEDPDALARRGGRAGAAATAMLLNADPPLHSRQRRLVNRAFSVRAAQAREPSIREAARGLIDHFAPTGEVEFVHDFAVPFPLTVIARALGVPLERMGNFKRWSDDFVAAIGNHNLTKDQLSRMFRSQGEFFDYFADEIDDRRTHPRDDIVTDVVQSRLDGEELTEPEMLGMFAQLLVAGNETTTKLIASAVLYLAQHPQTAGQLRAEPDLIASFVEEVLRLETPVQGLFRVANQATVIGGVDIPAGASVWVVYGAGNRDESVFDDPGRCVIGRELTHPHLAFGLGEHFCIGASLARVETRVALEELLTRFGVINLAVTPDALEYEPSYVLHGLVRLPLRLLPSSPEGDDLGRTNYPLLGGSS